MAQGLTRRGLLMGGLAAPALLLSGCDRLGASPSFRNLVLTSGERLSYKVHSAIGRHALAREYDLSQRSPEFRTNGNTRPMTDAYAAHEAAGFATWRLAVGGLVARPASLSMADLRARPSRTQTTLHSCVEGWSAIGEWTGAPLGAILDEAGLLPEARFVVLRCADSFGSRPYYESIDLLAAFHPQTILAYGMNGGPLPVGHGAPLRLRVERQLGYKQAKYLTGIEAVATLDGIGDGHGGHWEDVGFYDWYAGI